MTVAGSAGGEGLRLWKGATGEAVDAPLSHEGQPVTDVQFSDDGALLVTSDFGGTVRMWGGDGHLLWKRQFYSSEYDLRSSEDNLRIEAVRLQFASQGRVINVLFGATEIASLDVHSGDHVAPPISSVIRLQLAGWTDGAGCLLTVAKDGVVRLWFIGSQEPVFRLPKRIRYVALSEDRRVVATVDPDDVLCIVRSNTGETFEASDVVPFKLGSGHGNETDLLARRGWNKARRRFESRGIPL